jgi:hypothetical protein
MEPSPDKILENIPSVLDVPDFPRFPIDSFPQAM